MLTMTVSGAGLALAFALAALQGPPPAAPEPPAGGASGRILIADLKVIEEPKAPPQKPAGPADRPTPEAKAGDARQRDPPKPAPEPAPAKCYEDLLDFSLGEADSKTNERIKNQECK